MRRSLIALMTALAAVVAFSAPAAAIVYGQLADEGEFDNVGALIGEYQGARYIFCTGTLIAPTVFLTASHCVGDGQRMWVSFDKHVIEPVQGSVNNLQPGTAHAHPLYSCCGANNPYDVAVVVLDDPVDGIAPASLPTLRMLDRMSNRERNAATFTTAGYGTVRDTRRTASQALSFDGRLRWGEQSALSLEPAWLNLSMNSGDRQCGDVLRQFGRASLPRLDRRGRDGYRRPVVQGDRQGLPDRHALGARLPRTVRGAAVVGAIWRRCTAWHRACPGRDEQQGRGIICASPLSAVPIRGRRTPCRYS